MNKISSFFGSLFRALHIISSAGWLLALVCIVAGEMAVWKMTGYEDAVGRYSCLLFPFSLPVLYAMGLLDEQDRKDWIHKMREKVVYASLPISLLASAGLQYNGEPKIVRDAYAARRLGFDPKDIENRIDKILT